MSEVGEVEAALDARDTILAGVPEKCQPCWRPRIAARDLGESVVKGAITVEAATEELAEDIERNCRLGQGVVGRCTGNRGVCGYGGRELTDDERVNLAFSLGEEIDVDLLPRGARLHPMLRDFSGASTAEN